MPRLLAAVLDVLLVLVFALIGRASHDESLGVGALLDTAWPFLVGLALGWLVLGLRRLDPLGWRTGVWLWIATWGLGMLVRFATGGGTAPAFLIVAGVTLALFLVGWRAVSGLVRGHRTSRVQ